MLHRFAMLRELVIEQLVRHRERLTWHRHSQPLALTRSVARSGSRSTAVPNSALRGSRHRRGCCTQARRI